MLDGLVSHLVQEVGMAGSQGLEPDSLLSLIEFFYTQQQQQQQSNPSHSSSSPPFSPTPRPTQRIDSTFLRFIWSTLIAQDDVQVGYLSETAKDPSVRDKEATNKGKGRAGVRASRRKTAGGGAKARGRKTSVSSMEGEEDRSFEREDEAERSPAEEGERGLGMVDEEPEGEEDDDEEEGDDKSQPPSAKRARRARQTSQTGDGTGGGEAVVGPVSGAGKRTYRVFVPLSDESERGKGKDDLDLDGLKGRYPDGSLRIKLTDERIFNVLTNSHVRVSHHPIASLSTFTFLPGLLFIEYVELT
jgi:hypothetical protein